jgi:hypothetical protein
MFKSAPENAIDVSALVVALKAVPIGETITYIALSDAIGRNIKAEFWLLHKARVVTEKETGSRFAAVRGVGIKKLPTAEIVGIGTNARRRIRNAAKVASARLVGISANDMTPEITRKIDTERSLLGAISLVSTQSAVSQVEKKVSDSGPLPVGKTLSLFTG